MIDTHSHIYDVAFDTDHSEVIQRAKDAGVEKIILPNVDSESLPQMLRLEKENPGYCYAAIGLHPTSVKGNYKEELSIVEAELKRRKYIAIGEIGIDLYWDKTFVDEQIFVFQKQIEWALDYDLPIIIHVRDSFRQTMEALMPYHGKGLKGIFHSFTGDIDEANEIINFGGFKLGINGIVTFKNSNLTETLRQVDLKHIVLETDSPYLTPVPYRGKRNESSYVKFVCQKLSEVYNTTFGEIEKITTENACGLMKFDNFS
ncbi:TatD family deoxyribonuclease [Paludibacter sp. 221]|uniref:TatD family hydrolase n=1 Tax=Paludibacter sp. 221 TaxID=2302939 RepID=UPI0013D455B5|nr:TatD family hydrolase [Paludibacter sp. 221]NDV47323.1 TatD family deoxyribonuclease [Paludibacter sp. 221]